jgi:hypothetical protein
MIRYFCDKCNKEIGEHSELFKIEIEPPEIRRWRDDAETGTYIMCYDCVRLLNKWIKKPICSVSGRPYSECSNCENFKCVADVPLEARE